MRGNTMNLRAFIFDDDERIRSLLSIILERRGYKVLAFPDPTYFSLYSDTECSCPPGHVCGDILITDNNMPSMKGLEFIRNRMQNGCRGIVQNKAVMSGIWTALDLAYAKSLGCRIFEKPFMIEEIHKWLDECEKRMDTTRKLIDWYGASLNYVGLAENPGTDKHSDSGFANTASMKT
ncbi:MAG TPA: response regulator [Nitrospirae bacterium]|nr:response regulator [Nitrospirota bacterium]